MKQFHIIGPGRGGTSLLAGLIDAHPECEVSLEGFSHYLVDAPSTSREKIDRFFNACDEEARHSTALWGHKSTTEQLRRTDSERSYLIERLSAFPIIFIMRDARSCIPSKMKRNPQPIETAIHGWRCAVGLLRDFHFAGLNLFFVRFEDLVFDPSRELKRICRFLEVEYNSAILAGVNNIKISPVYRQDHFDQSRAAVLSQPWEDELKSDLEYCGYYIQAAEPRNFCASGSRSSARFRP